MIYTLGVLALASAGTILTLSILDWSRKDPRTEEILAYPSAVQRFIGQGNGSGVRPAEVSPLVVQAEAFALYLDPPKVSERSSNSVQTISSAPPVPLV